MIDGTIRVLDRALTVPRDGELVIVAEADAQPAGFAYAVTDDDFFTGRPHVHLSEIVSVRERLGVGRALMAQIERWAFDRGSRYISLNVLDANDGAVAFYRTLGYDVETRKMIKLKPNS